MLRHSTGGQLFKRFFDQVTWTRCCAHGDSQSALLGVSCECTLVVSVVMAVTVSVWVGRKAGWLVLSKNALLKSVSSTHHLLLSTDPTTG